MSGSTQTYPNSAEYNVKYTKDQMVSKDAIFAASFVTDLPSAKAYQTFHANDNNKIGITTLPNSEVRESKKDEIQAIIPITANTDSQKGEAQMRQNYTAGDSQKLGVRTFKKDELDGFIINSLVLNSREKSVRYIESIVL